MQIDEITYEYFFLILILIGCSTRSTAVDVNGHWHSLTSDCPFQTLDVRDSIMLTDRYNLIDPNNSKYSLKKIDGQYEIDFALEGEHLVIFDYSNNKSYSYFKRNLRDCLLNDRYAGLLVNVDLPVVSTAKSYDTIQQKYKSADLFIGKINKPDRSIQAEPDSVFIQVSNELIDIEKVRLYALQLKQGHNNRPTNLNMHVDKDISEEYIQKIVKQIK